jgi:predicted nucleotidyltransferase
MEKHLSQLTERLTKAYGGSLVSVVLYGSAAAGDYHGRYSDLNVLCVLERITPRELALGEPIFRWWRQLGSPAPLLLSEEELRTSTDCFPIEFFDIRERHRVLAGRDVAADLAVDPRFYRAQVEHELRAKLLRLRQKAAGVLSDKELLLRLMADSLSTFCVLARHALRLAGFTPGFVKRETLEAAAREFGLDVAVMRALLDLRENRVSPKSLDAQQLFGSYLAEIQALISVVDRMEK